MNDPTAWATKAYIKALQRGHLPKSLKEKLEKVFRPVFVNKKKDKTNV